MDQNVLNGILSRVEKPARYIGGELNSIIKRDAYIKIALGFPDVYEIGMSHLGSRILYHVMNTCEDTLCERVFAPWPDMEAELRKAGLSLFSLESKRPLKEFDVVAFSLLYEMGYTNIFTMLELSGIPFYASERGEDMPLVVRETRRRLSHSEGVYSPSFYRDEYSENGDFLRIVKLEDEAPDAPRRRIVRDLDAAPYIGKPIVPFLSIVHDRVAIELFRGCTRGCRFCQAGFIYRPVRERKLDTLMRQSRELVACTGYDEISLMSLSSGDYSEIHRLVPQVLDEFESQRVSVSLPSLRIDSFLKEDLEKMQSIRKAGLTLAPEAGTQRLRDVINKGVTEEDLLRSVRDAFEAGWNGVKLYFMIGLPTETDEDLLGIADLARKVSQAFYAMPKEKRGKGLRLSVSASSFVPKPWTPFQWEPQAEKAEIIRKQQFLRGALKGIRGVEFAYHAPNLSVLEAVVARGDRRIADVLVAAYKNGARFDSWDEHFKLNAWDKAFESCGIDPAYYANRTRDKAEALPWAHLDMLVTQKYLASERDKAYAAVVTKDCRKGCNACFGEKYANYCKI